MNNNGFSLMFMDIKFSDKIKFLNKLLEKDGFICSSWITVGFNTGLDEEKCSAYNCKYFLTHNF